MTSRKRDAEDQSRRDRRANGTRHRLVYKSSGCRWFATDPVCSNVSRSTSTSCGKIGSSRTFLAG